MFEECLGAGVDIASNNTLISSKIHVCIHIYTE
jgi:hypothetical protein